MIQCGITTSMRDIDECILMDESEFLQSELPLEELIACQRSMSAKHHDFFLIPRVEDE